MTDKNYGILTKQYYGKEMELKIVLTGKGFFIGTARHRGPVVRESLEYYQAHRDAQHDMVNDSFTQRVSLEDDDYVTVPVREE